MGRDCGYLAFMGGLATGAEQVYLHEEGMTLRDLEADLAQLTQGFEQDKRLALVVRNEYANPVDTTDFIAALCEEEGSDLVDVRREILGHLQQGGNPSPFDRIQATWLATKCIEFLIAAAGESPAAAAFIRLEAGEVQFHSSVDPKNHSRGTAGAVISWMEP